MVPLARRRKDTIRNIKLDPVDVIIHRVIEKMDDDTGGMIKDKKVLDSQVMRIFLNSVPSTTVVIGGKEITSDYIAICDFNADVKADSYTHDTFKCVYGSFSLDYVVPNIVEGQIASYQCYITKME